MKKEDQRPKASTPRYVSWDNKMRKTQLSQNKLLIMALLEKRNVQTKSHSSNLQSRQVVLKKSYDPHPSKTLAVQAKASPMVQFDHTREVGLTKTNCYQRS